MQLTLLILILLPLAEIYLMIKVGSIIGAFNTIFLTILTAVVGLYFAKLQGIATLRSALNNLRINKKPLGYIVSGFCLLIAAFFLILPGFMTDILGFLLLIPFTRKFILENFFTRTQENESDIIEIKPEEIEEEHDRFK
jgi:UPF0716 protein FxsA